MTPTEMAEMHGKADALERVNMRVRIAGLEAFARWALEVAGAQQVNPHIALSRIADEARTVLRQSTPST